MLGFSAGAIDVLVVENARSTDVPPRRAIAAAWLFELVLLAAVVVVIVRFNEVRQFAALLSGLRTRWLIAAVSMQALTYFCTASVWRRALAHEGCRCSTGTLVRVALVMLFTNQAIPTAGLSGAAIGVRALTRRHVPANLAVAALFVGLVTTYAAYFGAVVASILLLRVFSAVNLDVLLASAAFALIALLIPASVIWYRDTIRPRFRASLARVPLVATVLEAVAAAPVGMLRDRTLWRQLLVIQSTELLLDCATLFVLLAATGTHVAASAVFGSFVIASAVAEAAPIPSGLGTFEAALVGMLRLVGVSVEAGLTAALLFRGFALWLPMLPGLWFARRELAAHEA